MRLYVENIDTQQRIYLTHRAGSRAELERIIGGKSFHFTDEKNYTVAQVKAEPDYETDIAGIIIGAIVGLLIPPLEIGSIIGAVLGMMMSDFQHRPDREKCSTFNNS